MAGRADERVTASWQNLSQRYGLFYFFAQSCGACEVMSPIVQVGRATWSITVRAISTDGGPSRHFPELYRRDRPAHHAWGWSRRSRRRSCCGTPRIAARFPIGYGVMSADELHDRIYLLTRRKPDVTTSSNASAALAAARWPHSLSSCLGRCRQLDGLLPGDVGAAANVTGPTAFEGQAAGYYSLGNVWTRFPQNTTNLANLQLPRARAGCGGIDIFAGSFSSSMRARSSRC